MQCSKNFKKFEIIPEEKKTVNKRSLPIKASGVPSKTVKYKSTKFAKKIGIRFEVPKKNQIMKSVRSPCIHGNEVTKKTTYEVGSIEVKNTAVRCLSFFFQVHS